MWRPSASDLEGDKAYCYVENFVSSYNTKTKEFEWASGINYTVSGGDSGSLYDWRYGGMHPKGDTKFADTAAAIEKSFNQTGKKVHALISPLHFDWIYF